MAKKTKAANEPSLRDRLSESFLTAFEQDFQAHGASVIERLREKDPAKYAEIGARLIAAVEQTSADPYANVQTASDIGRRLLEQVGLGSPRQDQIERAVEENDSFVVRLQAIASGH